MLTPETINHLACPEDLLEYTPRMSLGPHPPLNIINEKLYRRIQRPPSFFKRLGQLWPEVLNDPRLTVEKKSDGSLRLLWSSGSNQSFSLDPEEFFNKSFTSALRDGDSVALSPSIFGLKKAPARAIRKGLLR